MRRRLCIVVCALAPAWALTLSLAAAAPAATQTAFLVADGLEGESTNAKFTNAIDILSWSWGVANAEGKTPVFQNFSVQKNLDRTSPRLLEYAAAGTVIPKAKLHVIKAGGDQQEFLRYCFAGVRITSLSGGGSSGSDQLAESVSFTYEFIVQRYARQKPDGTLDTPVFGGWNLLKNLVLPPGDC
jgi:type VI secretion system secreted protein Hcp